MIDPNFLAGADLLVLALLSITAIIIVRTRGLFAAAMITGIYSFLSAGWMMLFDAPDVAFTEAAVGAGISTVLMLATLRLITRDVSDAPPEKVVSQINNTRWGLLVVSLTGAALVYGTVDMPVIYDPNAPIHRHVAPRYLEDSAREIGIPNVVTSVLAAYRGYDTLGETTVIFTAGMGVLALLGRARKQEEQ